MKYMIVFLTVAFLAGPVAASGFFDDFEDDDISDWQEMWGDGTWWADDGQCHGCIDWGPAGIVPSGSPFVQDLSISSRVTGVHAFGVAARIDCDSGILAYLSTDHDVARIRKLEYGTVGQILTSIYVDFPSGVWYEVELTCQGEELFFTIDIPSTGQHWELSATDPTVRSGQFGIHMGREPGASWEWVSVDCQPSGSLAAIGWISTDDDDTGESSGDGDLCFEQNEEIELTVRLDNVSTEDLTGVSAVLESLDPVILVTDAHEDYGDILAGSSSSCADDFGLFASEGALHDVAYPMLLTLTADDEYQQVLEFSMPLGCGISDEIEGCPSDWSMGPADEDWLDDWHLSGARSHTPGGGCSFKCGDTGDGDYSDHLFCYLESPWFNAKEQATLHFWEWIDAQLLLARGTEALDGGILQIGQFDTWITVEPSEGYPCRIAQGTTGPFPEDTHVFSGYSPWKQVVAQIPDSLAGPLKVRFVFGSDDAGNREGWYVDDLLVTPHTPNQLGLENDAGPVTAAISVTPNPFSAGVEFTVVSRVENGAVRIFDIAGRTVDLIPFLADEGSVTLQWDGTLPSGIPLPPGIYMATVEGIACDPVRMVRLP